MADIRPNQLPDAVAFSPNDKLIIDQNTNGVRKTDPAPFVNYVAPIATTPEATGGTDDTARMTPLKTAQYVAGQIGTSLASNSQGAKADSAVQSVNGKAGNSVTLIKADVGLGNVDNTSDVNKPISTATQTALDGKVATTSPRLMPSGGTVDQVLAKSSNTDYATTWVTSTAATAVSYTAQTLNSTQQTQARTNISAVYTDDDRITGAIRKDVDQSAQTQTDAVKINILNNTLQSWEVVTGGYVNMTSVTANVVWSDLGDYRALRLTGFLSPSTNDASFAIRMGSGSPDSGENYRVISLSGHGSAVGSSVFFSQTFGYISLASGALDFGYGSVVSSIIVEFNKAKPAKFISSAGSVTNAGSDATGLISGIYNQTTARDTLQVVASTGTIAAGSYLLLEGMRG